MACWAEASEATAEAEAPVEAAAEAESKAVAEAVTSREMGLAGLERRPGRPLKTQSQTTRTTYL